MTGDKDGELGQQGSMKPTREPQDDHPRDAYVHSEEHGREPRRRMYLVHAEQ
jgi:hypothetical protein